MSDDYSLGVLDGVSWQLCTPRGLVRVAEQLWWQESWDVFLVTGEATPGQSLEGVLQSGFTLEWASVSPGAHS